MRLPTNTLGLLVGSFTALSIVLLAYGNLVITEFETLGGANTGLMALNDSGQVVGTSQTADGHHHGVIWTKEGGLVDIGSLGGDDLPSGGLGGAGGIGGIGGMGGGLQFTRADDINEKGEVVGVSITASGETHGFFWSEAAGMIDLGTLGGPSSFAVALNDHGQVIGGSITASGELHAFLWTQGSGMTDLGTAGESSIAKEINNLGQIAGERNDPSGTTHGFFWTAEDGMQDMTLAEGYQQVQIRDLNNVGQVVGLSGNLNTGGTHGFVWSKSDGMQDIGNLGYQHTRANAINDRGEVVGQSLTATFDHRPVLWTPAGGLVDLGTLGGGSHSTANAINNRGQIAGDATTASGVTHAFFWTAEEGMTDLGAELGEQTHSFVTALNENGQVLGWQSPGTPVLWMARSASQLIEQTEGDVERISAEAELTNGEKNALLTPLQGAVNSLEAGNKEATVNKMYAFLAKVSALVSSGRLSDDQSRTLINGAALAICLVNPE